jgi:iron(II)-dependent oxidoreductase
VTTVAFVLVSWTPDAPAGMERAVAAAAAGLARTGHRAVIVTCADPMPARPGTVVTRLRSLAVTFPIGDTALRAAATAHAGAVAGELADLYARHRVDAAVYIDALWGLGRIMPIGAPARRVLAAHVVGHDADLRAALGRPPSSRRRRPSWPPRPRAATTPRAGQSCPTRCCSPPSASAGSRRPGWTSSPPTA